MSDNSVTALHFLPPACDDEEFLHIKQAQKPLVLHPYFDAQQCSTSWVYYLWTTRADVFE